MEVIMAFGNQCVRCGREEHEHSPYLFEEEPVDAYAWIGEIAKITEAIFRQAQKKRALYIRKKWINRYICRIRSIYFTLRTADQLLQLANRPGRKKRFCFSMIKNMPANRAREGGFMVFVEFFF